jgi:UDP-2,3-diacylglucosamine pyrophosphatase LpxH
MVIVATSDQHLGMDTSDKTSFEKFLDQILLDTTITDFVLLGDVVDMWRRDASGVFLENRTTFDKIASVAENIKVHYVYGNHDYHLRYLKDHAYPFKFCPELPLREDGGKKIRFVHGYQFDDLMKNAKPLLDALCRVMSDDIGNCESVVWAILTRDWSAQHYFTSLRSEKRRIRKSVKALLQKPEVRLAGGTLDDIEKEACTRVKPGEILVFGHTHVPFINESGTVVNTGCWVKDAPVHNTYVRLDADGPRLFEFRKGDITEKVRRRIGGR